MSNVNLSPRQVKNYISSYIAPVYYRMVLACNLKDRIIMDDPIVEVTGAHPYDVFAVIQKENNRIWMNPIAIIETACKDQAIVELVRKNASDNVILNRLQKIIKVYAKLALEYAINYIYLTDNKIKKKGIICEEEKEIKNLKWSSMEKEWLYYQEKSFGNEFGYTFSPESVMVGYEKLLKSYMET